jgi:DNA topoisomerase-1
MPPKYAFKSSYKKKGVSTPRTSTLFTDQNLTATYLLIVESPSKCSKIEHYLGGEYKCIASIGHIRELLGLSAIDMSTFTPTFTLIEEKRTHVEQMKAVIGRFAKDRILLATDDDREGEAIAWHICEVFGLPIHTTSRIVFREITKTALVEAVKNPRTVDMNLVHAQHARQLLDIIVGFKVSPILWSHVYHSKANALSAGRCQTPALRLVYDNDQERKRSDVETRYKTTGYFFAKAIPFVLNHEFEKADEVGAFLEKERVFSHMLTIDETKRSVRSAPTPLNTSRLLQMANNQLHYSPKKTMMVCQKLYQDGRITYMRTENTKYARAFLDKAGKYITERYGDGRPILGDFEILENKDTQNPHEAIRVTQVDIESLPEPSDPSESSLYRLIWRNTVESCMAAAEYDVTHVHITASTESLNYTHILEVPVFLGWKKVSSGSDLGDTVSLLHYFRSLSPTTPVHYQYIESLVVVRNKHTHYTESTLIRHLEELGIGRPSTFALLVDTIQERGYVKRTDIEGVKQSCNEYILRKGEVLETVVREKVFGAEKNKLAIQPLGIICVEFLNQHFTPLFSYDYTRTLEEQLDLVACAGAGTGTTNHTSWNKICQDCCVEIAKLAEPLAKQRRNIYPIDAGWEVIFQQYGVSMRKRGEDGEYEYRPVTPDYKIDMDKLRSGGYTYQDLVAVPRENLGTYEGKDVLVKVGKYGPYVVWGEQRKSIAILEKALSSIELADVIPILEGSKIDSKSDSSPLGEDGLRHATAIPGMVRSLTTDLSIRNGKFGNYIYYKPQNATKPQFFKLWGAGCPKDWKTCEPEKLIQWIETTYLQKI